MSASICACGHHVSAHPGYVNGCMVRACPCPAFHVGVGPQGQHEPVSSLPPDPALCPTHGVPLVAFCPACRGAAGGRVSTPAKATAARGNAAKARAARGRSMPSP